MNIKQFIKKQLDVIVLLLCTSYLITITIVREVRARNYPLTWQSEEEWILDSDDEDSLIGEHYVTVTRYNPVTSQCDSDPLVTADNSRIDLDKLDRGELRWIALSRDLLHGGHFNYGDVVELYSEDDPDINGEYEIHDTMNSRFEKRADILTGGSKARGKYDNVRVSLVKKKKGGD